MKSLKLLPTALLLTLPFVGDAAPYHMDSTPVQSMKYQEASKSSQRKPASSSVQKQMTSEDKLNQRVCTNSFIEQIQWEMRANVPPYSNSDGPR